MRLKQRMVKDLPTGLTDFELTERAKRLSSALREVEEIKAQHATEKAQMKTEMDDAVAAVAELSKVIRDREEKRPVDCELLLDDDEKLAYMVRTDTGEVLSHRTMTDDELQAEIDAEYAQERCIRSVRRYRERRDHSLTVIEGGEDLG
jgi:hypothetical protein